MTVRPRLAVAALALSLVAPFAGAHEAWLLPSSTVLSAPGYVTLDGAVSNQTFHFNYRPMMIRDNLAITAPDGTAVQPEGLTQGKLRTVFDANLAVAGTYRVALTNASVMASWKEGSETKRWRGTHEALAANVPADAAELSVREGVGRIETFITVGSPTPVTPTGLGLEMVSVTHPNDLYVGEAATFGFVIDGKPVADVKVELMAGGMRYRDQLDKITLVTDAKGQVTHTWAEPGMYYLKAMVDDRGGRIANAERRLSYVATLEVLPQ